MTTYTPSNAKLEKLIATNARVDDLLENASASATNSLLAGATATGANALIALATSNGNNATFANDLAGDITTGADNIAAAVTSTGTGSLATTFSAANVNTLIAKATSNGNNATYADDLAGDITATGANVIAAAMTATGADAIVADVTDKTDFVVFMPAWQVGQTTDSLVLALTRNAAGDYSLNGTANGAENIFLFGTVPVPARTTASKGFRLSSVKAVYEIGVADATSIDLVVNATTHAHDTAHAIAAHGGTVTYDANHDTAGERIASAAGSNPHLLIATLGTPAFQVTAATYVTAELQVVLANTNTFRFYGFEFLFNAVDYL
jgi:hypothetical protein